MVGKAVKGKAKKRVPAEAKGKMRGGRLNLSKVVLQHEPLKTPEEFITENSGLEIGGVPAIRIMKDLQRQAQRYRSDREKVRLLGEAADFIVALEKESGKTIKHNTNSIAKMLDSKLFNTYRKPRLIGSSLEFLQEHGLVRTPMKSIGSKSIRNTPILKPLTGWNKVRIGNMEAPYVNLPEKTHPDTRVGHPDVARFVTLFDYLGGMNKTKKGWEDYVIRLSSPRTHNSSFFVNGVGEVVEKLLGRKPTIRYTLNYRNLKGKKRVPFQSLQLIAPSKTLGTLLTKELGYKKRFPARVLKEIVDVPEFRRPSLQLLIDNLLSFNLDANGKFNRGGITTTSKIHRDHFARMLKKEGIQFHKQNSIFEEDGVHVYTVGMGVTQLHKLFKKVKPKSPYNVAALAVGIASGEKHKDFGVLLGRLHQLMKSGEVRKKCAWIIPHINRVMPEFDLAEYPQKVAKTPPPRYHFIPKEGITTRELSQKLGVSQESVAGSFHILMKDGWVTRKKEPGTYKKPAYRYFKKGKGPTTKGRARPKKGRSKKR